METATHPGEGKSWGSWRNDLRSKLLKLPGGEEGFAKTGYVKIVRKKAGRKSSGGKLAQRQMGRRRG